MVKGTQTLMHYPRKLLLIFFFSTDNALNLLQTVTAFGLSFFALFWRFKSGSALQPTTFKHFPSVISQMRRSWFQTTWPSWAERNERRNNNQPIFANIPAKRESYWYAGNPTRGCTTDNLSCLPASNTAEVLSRCLSARWFPRQQEYDNVAFDMTEGIISLTNRDNRHKEG